MAGTSSSPATSASPEAWPHASTRRCPHRCRGPSGARSGCYPTARFAAGPARCSASPRSPKPACRTRSARGSASSRTPIPRRCWTARGTTGALEDYRAIWRSSEGAQPLDRLLDLNLRTYLLDDLLVKADRMSMAHGLEVRSPFLDTRPARLHDAPPARAQGSRAVAQARAEGRREGPRAGRDPEPAEEGLRRPAGPLVSRGSARTTSAARSAPPTRG